MISVNGQISSASDPDSFYVSDCRLVQDQTSTIQTLAGQISRQLGGLETEKDYCRCRHMLDSAVQLTAETRTILLRIQQHQQQAQTTSEKNNRKMMYKKLSDNLGITARVLEDVVRQFGKAGVRWVSSSGHSGADVAGGQETVHSTMPKLSPTTLEGTVVFEEELEGERRTVLRKVDEDMRCLQRLYTDLATASSEQQDDFDCLENHLALASADLERGWEEIRLADKNAAWDRNLKRKLVRFSGLAAATAGFIFYWMS